MNSKGILLLTDHAICMKCLKEKATHVYSISGRGYGSLYDNIHTKFQVCDHCDQEEYATWFHEVPKVDKEDYWEDYDHEEKIYWLVDSLSLEAQELFYNSFSNEGFMEAQDWIDEQLEELPYDKCKDYGIYSAEEKRAYRYRFPTCDKVYLKTYHDGSECCKCKRGVYGKSDGSCEDYTYSGCYLCTNYAPRINKMEVVYEKEEFIESEKLHLEDMLKYAQERLEALNKGYDFYIKQYGG